MRGTPEERFWKKVAVAGPDDCWLWMGARQKHGHGLIKIGGKLVKAHRFSYQLANGDLDPLLDVCHKCDNPPCVNSAHLYQGTAKDNMADRENHGRGNHQRGERANHVILNWEKVREIRRLWATGDYTLVGLAKANGVSKGCITSIVYGRTWLEC